MKLLIRWFVGNSSAGKYLPRSRHWRGIKTALAGGVLLLALAWADQKGLLLHPGGGSGSGGDWQRYEGRWFRVVSVIDGDTIRVDCPDGDDSTTRVRLWGIDCPETAKPGRAAQPYANEATDLVRRLCLGREICLRLEPHEIRDKFGRLLAYVDLPDQIMLNEQILLAGLARADDRFSHRYMDWFGHLEERARRERVGIWGDTFRHPRRRDDRPSDQPTHPLSVERETTSPAKPAEVP